MPSITLGNEDQLLARVAKGDQYAFKEIYDSYFSKTYNFAFYVFHHRESAQEVVQEVMLHIWKMGAQLLDIRHLEAYIKTLAKRRAIDLLRRIELERTTSENTRRLWQEGHNDTVEAISSKTPKRSILDQGIARYCSTTQKHF